MKANDFNALASRFPVDSRVSLATLVPDHGTVRHWTEWQTRKKADGSTYTHKALDIDTVVGTEIYSPGVGVVLDAGYQVDSSGRGWGHYIKIKFPRTDLTILMAHMKKAPNFKTGQSISYGDLIGATGSSGTKPPAPHLHLETWYKGEKVPPSSIFTFVRS